MVHVTGLGVTVKKAKSSTSSRAPCQHSELPQGKPSAETPLWGGVNGENYSCYGNQVTEKLELTKRGESHTRCGGENYLTFECEITLPSLRSQPH